MYTKINITENSLRILSLFTNGFDREYHIREAGKVLSLSPRTAQLILEVLEEKGILESRTKGRTKLYTLKIHEASKRYLVFAEQYKSIDFFEKHLMVKEVIERIIPSIDGVGIIFGSQANGTATKDSDLDIFIAGSYNKKAVESASKTFGVEISVKCYPFILFEKNAHRDFLLKEVLKNHIIFLNAELFIRTVTTHG